MKSSTLIIPVVIVASAAMISGCFSSEPAKRRGPLSDAVEKASDDNEGSRVVETPPVTERSHDDDSDELYTTVATVASNDADSTTHEPVRAVRSASLSHADSSKRSTNVWLSIAGGPGLSGGDAFADLSNGSLRIGGEIGERGHVDLVGSINRAPLNTSTTLYRAVNDDILIFSGGGEGRWYTTPKHTALGHYVMGGIGFTTMAWDYRNAIVSGGDIIRGDRLNGIELYIGTGFEIVRTSRFRFGIEALPGIMIWSGTTSSTLR